FHAASALGTLVMEFAVPWMMFFPRRVRIICFFIVTPWEIGVILTANYTFLNYLVLSLGFLLLDDNFLRGLVPARWRPAAPVPRPIQAPLEEASLSIVSAREATAAREPATEESERAVAEVGGGMRRHWRAFRFGVSVVM